MNQTGKMTGNTAPVPCPGIEESAAGPSDRAILYERGDTQFIARIVVGVRAAARVSAPAEQIQNRSQDQTCVSELQPHCQPC